jgi:hypothetical protein
MKLLWKPGGFERGRNTKTHGIMRGEFIVHDNLPANLRSGRGAAPPESCGGSRGYRLMLKRQQQGASVSDPALVEATIQLLSATHPEQPAGPRNLLRDAVREGWQNVDRRLLEHGPLEPECEIGRPLAI